MPVFQAIVLAVVQGVTEFLPVSSDGHLVLVPWLFGWEDQGLAFDGAIHLGTLGAVVIFFRRELFGLVRGVLTGAPVQIGSPGGEQGEIRPWRLVLLLALALVPTSIIGFALKDSVEGPLRKPEWAGAFLMVTGMLLMLGEVVGRRVRRMEEARQVDTVAMGIAQGLAVLPGLSRSGSTIAAGLASGLTREAAGRMSFLIAVPAILGAGALLLFDMSRADEVANPGWGVIAIGVAGSFVTGLLALRLLMWLLRKRSLRPFAYYCLAAGAAVVLVQGVGA